MAIPNGVDYLFAALFGAVLGSFLNVCISRLPEHQSVVSPRSRCPRCGAPIRAYDNIPILSYVILGGRCRSCRERISPVYPLVELITASLFVLALAQFGPTPLFFKAIIFSMLMVVLIFTDLNARTIPHSVTLTGVGLGIVFSFLIPVGDSLTGWILARWGADPFGRLDSFASSIAGAVFGAGFLYVAVWLVKLLFGRGKEYLGFGDVMLILVVGAFWGVTLTYVTLLFGVLAAVAIAIPLGLLRRSFRRGYEWPLGSFLAAAAIFALFEGQTLVQAYLRWARLR